MKRQDIHLARGLRRGIPDAERALWRHLRGRRFQDWKFRRQHAIGPFIVDFVCLDARLIVELDGGQHLEQSRRDEERTHILEHEGYRVIRFWNDDVLVRTDAVLQEILNALKVPPHPDPLPGGEREKSTRLALVSVSPAVRGAVNRKNVHLARGLRLSPSPRRGEGKSTRLALVSVSPAVRGAVKCKNVHFARGLRLSPSPHRGEGWGEGAK